MSIGRWFIGLIIAGLALTVLPVAVLRVLPPPTTAFMLQSPVKPVQYQWVPRDKISEQARRAVVASEDQKFWTHQGFDLEAIEKARVHNETSRRKRGASTISQQTAKNLFLWSGGGYFRKGIEAGYTILIEAMWPKERILEVYLNIAEFGPGLYGVEAAAQAYFHKSAAALSASEAARLAAVLPSPRRWSVTQPGRYVQSRGAWILRQMGHGGSSGYSEPEPEMPEELRQQIEAEEAGQDHFYIESPQSASPSGDLEPIEADPHGTGPQQAIEPIPIPPPEPAPAPEPVEPSNDPAVEPAPEPAPAAP